MRFLTVLLTATVIAVVGGREAALGYPMVSPGGTTPGGAIFDGLRGATTRPVPRVSPSPAPPAPDTWVPDRYVQVPGVDGTVLVPGHWERRLSDHEVYTPPLVGQTPDGRVLNFPAGRRPPVQERQGP
jgi:hypothetical protein